MPVKRAKTSEKQPGMLLEHSRIEETQSRREEDESRSLMAKIAHLQNELQMKEQEEKELQLANDKLRERLEIFQVFFRWETYSEEPK